MPWAFALAYSLFHSDYQCAMTNHTTREAWLLAAVELLRPIFKEKQHIIPGNCQVSCGFASTGSKHHIGQCWSRKSSVHDSNQIFVSPALLDPVLVLDTLVHELVHAVDDCENKHGKEFKKIALSLGMIGPMRSAGAGPALKAKLAELSSQLGPYPHGGLHISTRLSKRSPRPRAKCKACGFEVPMYKKFLAFGPPLCPKHKTEMEPLGDWEWNLIGVRATLN